MPTMTHPGPQIIAGVDTHKDTHTAAVLDSGARGGTESSIAKTFVAEAVNRVVDRAVQITGALGISGDVLLSRYLREVRPFRIYDGPSEVHRWAIARRAISQRRRAIEAGEQPRFQVWGQS